jgi:hypothetical protein
VPVDSAVEGKLTIQVDESQLDENGDIEIIAINDEQVALGSYDIPLGNAALQETVDKSFPIWVLFLVGGVLIFWVVFFVSRKKRLAFNSRNKRR